MYFIYGNIWLKRIIFYIMKPLLLSFISGLSTILGSLITFFKIKRVEEFTTYILSLSMSIMTIISLFDLIPKSTIILINNYKIVYGLLFIILTFLLGYLTIFIISNKINDTNSLYRVGVLSMISLMLHNFPEGIAVFMSAYDDIKVGIKLCIAMMLHNIPEGMAIAVPIYYSKESRGRAFFYTLISSLSEPIGALLSFIFLKRYINDILISFILIFVSGLMISLSYNDIYKEIKKYNKNKYIIYGIISSIIIYILLYYIN